MKKNQTFHIELKSIQMVKDFAKANNVSASYVVNRLIQDHINKGNGLSLEMVKKHCSNEELSELQKFEMGVQS